MLALWQNGARPGQFLDAAGRAVIESRPPCPGDEIGKHSGLKQLSARLETAGAEPFKFGEPPGAFARGRE